MSLNVGDIWLLLGADLSPFRRGLSDAEGAASRSGNIIANAFSTAIGIGIEKAVSALTNAIKDAATALFDYQKSLDTLSISFTTMLGSADAAAVFLERLKNFDGSNLFGLDKMADASKKMLAFGWAANSVLPDLTAIGNATAALGLDSGGMDRIIVALGQMRIKASISAEEIRQLINANLNVLPYLEKAFGITGAQMKDLSKTGISGMQGVDAIIKGMANDPKFVGMMAAMQGSVTGATSVMINQLKQMGDYVTGGLYSAFKDTFVNIVTDFATMKKQMQENGVSSFFNTGSSEGAEGSTGGMEKLMQLSPEWTARIAGIGDTILKLVETAQPILEKLANIVVQAIAVICDAFLLIKPALDLTIDIFGVWYNLMVDRMGALVQFFDDAISMYSTMWAEAAVDVQNTWNKIVNYFTWYGNAISDILNWMLTGGGLWAEGWANLATSIGDVFAELKAWALKQITDMVNGMLEKLGPVGGLIKNLASAGYSAFQSLSSFISGSFTSSMDGATKSGNRFLDLLKKIDTTKKAYDKKKGEEELAANKGGKGLEPGDASSKKGSTRNMESVAAKLENRADEIYASFAEKTSKLIDSDYTSNLMGVAKDILKANNSLDAIELDLKDNATKYSKQGVDVGSALEAVASARKAIAEYQTSATTKYLKDQELVEKSFSAKTVAIAATTTGDKIALINATYEASRIALEKEQSDLMKSIGNKELVNQYVVEQNKVIEKQKADATRDALDTQMQEEIDKNTFLYAQGKISAKQLNDITRNILDERLKALETELLQEGLTADQIIAIRKRIVDTTDSKNATTGSLGDQARDAIREVQEETLSAKDIIKQSWEDISSSISDTLSEVFNKSVSFGDGIKTIFSDISKAIAKMMLDIVIQAAILEPLKSSWSSTVGSWFPTTSSTPTKKASGGPVGAGEMVQWNEAGEEYFVSGRNGTVLPHDLVSKLNNISGNSNSRNVSSPVIMNVYGVSDTDSFKRSKGQILAGLNTALMQGRRNL